MDRIKDYRRAAVAELERQLHLPEGAEKLIFVDAQLDTLIRTVKGLPARPLERLPYEGLFQLEPKEETPEVMLLGFTGDLAWIHAREGHAGRPYWPGGGSGLTLDPGFDLGYQNEASLRRYYGFLKNSEAQALASCLGVRGPAAKDLPKRAVVSDIRISTGQAHALMPLIAKPYWDGICGRFPNLVAAPSAVQTVLLSLAFNRGKNNRALEVLRNPLERGDYAEVGRLVSTMQQDHQLSGIRKRRKLEGMLIAEALGDAVV